MNKFMTKIFSIILLLFSFTSLVSKSNYESYVNSIFYCIYNKKYEIKFENHIPLREEKELILYLRERINELEKHINMRKVIILVRYDNEKESFTFSIKGKNEENINPKYI